MRLIELCAGSAALTMRAWDREPLVPYMGGKGRYAESLLSLLEIDRPTSVALVDPGPWGKVWSVLADPATRLEVRTTLSEWSKQDPRGLWTDVASKPPPDSPVRFAATFLFLQRLSFAGKPVHVVKSKWRTGGFNETSAYGTPAREGFGAVKPQLPSLVQRLADMPFICELEGRHHTAKWLRIPSDARGTTVYIDPPYQGTTGYGHDFERAEVINLALRWAAAGARVAISESEPLDIPGWRSEPVQRSGKKSDWQTNEWVTMSFPSAQPSLF